MRRNVHNIVILYKISEVKRVQKKSLLSCPVCGGEMEHDEKSYQCENNHCFDISKFGTVNLLQSNSSKSKRHGDDTLMVTARRDFLDKDYYLPLANAVASLAKEHCPSGGVLADIGCGEGYYTDIISKNAGFDKIIGIDISKQALRFANKRLCCDDVTAEFAVASAFKLPIGDSIVDCLVNIFAPFSASEFSRVIKNDGIVIRAFARKNHLIGLKQAIYDEVRNEDVEDLSLDGFEMIDSRELEYEITMDDGQTIDDLFKMTPYYYKSSKESQNRLANLTNLSTKVHFCVCVYKKTYT